MIASYLYLKGKRAKNSNSKGNPNATAQQQHGSKVLQPASSRSFVNREDPKSPQESNAIETNEGPVMEDSDEQSKADARRRRIYRLKLILALLPCQFLASVDFTIVSTALTTIASHFDQLQQFNWIVTAYSLCSTAFIPAFGQIADTFGRHAALQLSMLCMLIGSALCAAAQTWGMLLLGRAFQGVSAAGIANIIKIVLADKVTLAEQSKNNTIFMLVAGLSTGAGPVIGGSLAVTNWRYCFVISIPISALAMVLIFVLLRKELLHGTHHFTGPGKKSLSEGLSTIDYGGTVLFIFGTGLVVLATSWGGPKYAWNSVQVLAPLVVGATLFILFFIYEYLLEPGKLLSRTFPNQVAMIPWALFERKDVILLSIISTATGASLYSAIYFVGIFWTLVQAMNPQESGYRLLYYMPGIGIGIYSAMFLCNVFPRQTFYPLFIGSIVEAAGFSVLAYATHRRNSTLVSLMLAFAGAGSGLRMMPGSLHAAGIWRDRIAAVMSLMSFTMPFGGTLAIAVMSSVFYNKFAVSLSNINLTDSINTTARNSTQSIQSIDALPLVVQHEVREAGARAVMWSFISVLPIMGCSITAAAMLGNVWISPKTKTGVEASKGAVLYEPYLLTLLTGKLKSKRQSVDDHADVVQVGKEHSGKEKAVIADSATVEVKS